jgi:hypothetical protein
VSLLTYHFVDDPNEGFRLATLGRAATPDDIGPVVVFLASLLTPGEIILLLSWKDHGAAEAFDSKVTLREEARLRRVRVVRDYSMFDRREAPQYYPEVKPSS